MSKTVNRQLTCPGVYAPTVDIKLRKGNSRLWYKFALEDISETILWPNEQFC